jgi:hypothetical protein
VAKLLPMAELVPSRRKFGLRDLFRLAIWGVSAACTLFVALYAATTEIGRDRLFVAFAEIHEVLMPTGVKPVRPLDAREGRRLAETVRLLAADRDRLQVRVATLEQSLDGITGSIARVEKAVRTSPPAPTPGAAPSAAPAPSAPAVSSTAPAEPPPTRTAPDDDLTSSIPMPPQPPGPGAGKTEFGIDLGSATTVEALRTAWTAALRRHGPLLEGLRPVVQMRERPRPGGMELRLIAGPVPSAAIAARLCASMTAAGAICAPSVFEGQRLAVR